MRDLAVHVGDLAGLCLIPDDRDLARVARGDPRPEDARARRGRHRDRRRPCLPEVLRPGEHDPVRRRTRPAAAAPGRAGLPVVGVPDEIDGAGGVERDRRPVRVHRGRGGLVRRERSVAGAPRADADGVRRAVRAGVHDGLDQLPLSVVELPEAGIRAAVRRRAGVRHSRRGAARAAVRRAEGLVAQRPLERVGRHEHLVGRAAGEPGPVAVVALHRPLRPRLAAVGRREERVVHEVDARVVDPAAGVHRQVGIAEARVDRRAGRAGTVEVAVADPVHPAVGGPPDVDLVAVVRAEAEVAEGRADESVAVQVRRTLVGRVDERSVHRVGEHERLSSGELLVDVDRRSECDPGCLGGLSRRSEQQERRRGRGDDELPHDPSLCAGRPRGTAALTRSGRPRQRGCRCRTYPDREAAAALLPPRMGRQARPRRRWTGQSAQRDERAAMGRREATCLLRWPGCLGEAPGFADPPRDGGACSW